MEQNDIRWKQRLENFNNSMHNLQEAVKIDSPDMIQKAGTIQLFEISIELSWKLLKDYLESKGMSDLKFPRDIIKKAKETELISDGDSWLHALESRNLTSHTYDEETAERVVTEIKNNFFPILKDLQNKFSEIN